MVTELLRQLAERYETADFIQGDPSWFMHQVQGRDNQEAMAWLASCLSYGIRTQFMPRIEWLLDRAGGEVDRWVRQGDFEGDVCAGDERCFYRLYTCRQMNALLRSYQKMLLEYGTMGEYVRRSATDGYTAIEAICRFYRDHGSGGIVPQDTVSACKRICMFLRWMVRNQSPVDLGLWADFIDRRTLIMPLDTHVVQQSMRLNLLHSKSASMTAARRLTEAMCKVFPDDPLRGDFALFGLGVDPLT